MRSSTLRSALLGCALSAALWMLEAVPASARSGLGPLVGTGETAVNSDATWWQFVLSFPFPDSPVNDATGERCQLGQQGHTWYLYGTFGGPPVVRECTIPTNKRLLIPVYNSINVGFPGDTISLLRQQLADQINNVDVLSVTVDDTPVKDIVRLKSGVFEVALQEDNLFDLFLPVAAGIYGPAVTDGYWVRLTPLPAGDHEIRILGGIGSPFVDVTYHLHVVAPEPIVP